MSCDELQTDALAVEAPPKNALAALSGSGWVEITRARGCAASNMTLSMVMLANNAKVSTTPRPKKTKTTLLRKASLSREEK